PGRLHPTSTRRYYMSESWAAAHCRPSTVRHVPRGTAMNFRSLTCAALVAFLLATLLCINIVSAAPTAGSAKSSPAKSGAPGSATAAKKAAAVIEEVDVALRGQIGTVGALVCPIYKASL